MAVYSIIKKSELERAMRLDAEYYQPEYFIDFSKGNWQPIGEHLKKCQYGLSLAMNDERVGYPIYKMDNIDDGFLFEDNVRYVKISEKEAGQYLLRKNDIFFNRVNSSEFVGRTGIFKDGPISVFASYLICLEVKENGTILPDYLNIFLNSKYGKKQIKKYSRRAVNQANVNAEELKQMRIAVLPTQDQEKIAELSNKSWQEFQNSKSLYSKAESLLLEELGVKKEIGESENLYNIVNLSDIQKAKRMDAEYFQDKFETLINHVAKKVNIKKLEAIFNFKRGIFINIDYYRQEKTPTPYIRIKELSNRGGIDESKIIFIDKKYTESKGSKLKKNDLVIAIIGDTIGKTNKITKNLAGGYCSNNTGRLRLKDGWIGKILPDYLELLFQSVFIQSQIEQKKAPTGQPKINDKEIESMQIPIISKPVQQKIADLVQKSHEAKRKAKELLEEAKRKVEDYVEYGRDG